MAVGKAAVIVLLMLVVGGIMLALEAPVFNLFGSILLWMGGIGVLLVIAGAIASAFRRRGMEHGGARGGKLT